MFDISRTLRKNIASSTLSRFASQILAIFSNFILARALGVTSFGEYVFISAIVLIGNAISTFGTDMVLIRKISAEKDYSDISTALAIQLMISFALIFFVLVFSSLQSLRIYIFSLIPLSFFTITTIVLRGSHNINLFSILHFAFNVLQFVSVCLVYLFDENVNQLAVLLLISHFLSATIGIIFCKIKIPNFIDNLLIFPENISTLLRASFSLALIGSLRLIYERFAVAVMPFVANLSITGLLSASVRVTDAVKLGYISAFTPIYPEMARDKKFLSLQTGFKLLLLSSIFISLLLFFLSAVLVKILFGEEFIDTISSLQILAWMMTPYVIVSYYSLAFVSLDMQKPVLISLGISLFVLVTMLPLGYQVQGLVGSAFVILFAEIIQASLLFIQWRKYALSKLSK